MHWHLGFLKGDPSSSTRDQTHTPWMGRQSLNHWTTREAPQELYILRRCGAGQGVMGIKLV